jgi:hypothetical protein
MRGIKMAQQANTLDVTNQAQTQQTGLSNPRIIQLDTILNRSQFIWARKQHQQASNNN